MALLLCLVSALLLQQSFQAITPPIRPRPSSPRSTIGIQNREEALHTGEQGVIITSSELTGGSSAAASNETHISEAAEIPSPGRESGGSAIVPEPMLTSNLAAKPDSYDMYKHLMEVQAALTLEPSEEDAPEVKTLKSALKTLFETAWQGLYYGFMPEVARHRRSVGVEVLQDFFKASQPFQKEKSHLDTFITFMGAFFGMQNCSEVIACRTGRMAAERLPGAAVLVMMAESVIPIGLKSWFAMVKRGVMGIDEDCTIGLRCSLDEES